MRSLRIRRFIWVSCAAIPAFAQQPPEPVDITPITGDAYYLLNQSSGLAADLNHNSTLAGDRILQQPQSFSSSSQRWTFTLQSNGAWQIGNVRNGLCLDTANHGKLAVRRRGVPIRPPISESLDVVQNPCAAVYTQEWSLTPEANGYYTIASKSTGLAIEAPTTPGAPLNQAKLPNEPNQNQQWLLRPAFFRGIDNALLEKQEAARIAAGTSWWKDAGQPRDVLQIFKNHGINMVRLRPSSVPPYVNISAPGCTGNACYGETDTQDLDLAKRARNLGMSLELTLLFDGGSSASVPPAWSGDTQLSKLQSDLYAYVKAEILSYRQAGLMPDIVSIGNEVDTGFLGSIGSPTGANFGGFASLQTSAIQAVKDAAAGTSAGPPIPPPLTCIHITPAWDLTQFFTLAQQYKLPNEAICQSYYPFFHGSLANEQTVLNNAAKSIGKPILILETAEHFETGFDANDPWYAPPTPDTQRQFLIDLQNAVQSLPNNLGMGICYWDPAGVNIQSPSGGLVNGDNKPDAIYIWNGLTLFDDNSATLPALDALGGKQP